MPLRTLPAWCWYWTVPVSESVRQAAQALRYAEERATVALISDGLETCDIDYCHYSLTVDKKDGLKKLDRQALALYFFWAF